MNAPENENMWETLNAVFRQVFNDPSICVRPESTSNDIDGWDSLSHVNLILAVETRFRIKFSQKEIFKFRNVGDMASCIEGKISK